MVFRFKKALIGNYMTVIKSVFSFCLIFALGSYSSVLTAKESKRVSIIALAPHIVEMLYQVGAGEQIIGTSEHSDYPAAALTIPRVGNYAQLDIERILALKPDLIIAWQSGNPESDLARLKGYGFQVVYSNPKQLEDVAQELKRFAKLAGRPEQGQMEAEAFLNGLEAIKSQYANKSIVKVFYEIWARPLTTIANNAWPQQQLSVCGAKNILEKSKADYPQINAEQVVLAAPEIIIQPQSGNGYQTEHMNWYPWSEIPAVKTKAFIHPDTDKLHRMTSRMLDELESLCRSIEQFRITRIKPNT
jgi:vitamin B12 transport system substrate-binding protein